MKYFPVEITHDPHRTTESLNKFTQMGKWRRWTTCRTSKSSGRQRRAGKTQKSSLGGRQVKVRLIGAVLGNLTTQLRWIAVAAGDNVSHRPPPGLSRSVAIPDTRTHERHRHPVLAH